MVGKTFDEWFLSKKNLNNDDRYGARLAWDFQQEKIDELGVDADKLIYEIEKLEQQVVELECDKETWFTKYHDKRAELKYFMDTFEEKLAVLNQEHSILINKMKCCCNCGYDSKLEACDDCDETFKNWRMK